MESLPDSVRMIANDMTQFYKVVMSGELTDDIGDIAQGLIDVVLPHLEYTSLQADMSQIAINAPYISYVDFKQFPVGAQTLYMIQTPKPTIVIDEFMAFTKRHMSIVGRPSGLMVGLGHEEGTLTNISLLEQKMNINVVSYMWYRLTNKSGIGLQYTPIANWDVGEQLEYFD